MMDEFGYIHTRVQYYIKLKKRAKLGLKYEKAKQINENSPFSI